MQSGHCEASAPFKLVSFKSFSLLGAKLDGLSVLDALSCFVSLSKLNTRYSIPCSVFEPKTLLVFSTNLLAVSFRTARRIDVSGTPLRSANRLLLMKQVSLPQPHDSR